MADALDFSNRPTILVVDDTPDNLTLISGLLKDTYKVKVANSGERALKAVQGDGRPDLILLDIMMPGMDGYEVCRRLVADPATSDIPIIFLTAKSQVEDETMGFELGAADYLIKPVSPPILMARVKTQLSLKAAEVFLRDQNTFLEAEVQRRGGSNAAIHEFTLRVLAGVVEKAQGVEPNRIQRTQRYVAALVERLSGHVRFAGALAEERGAMMVRAVPLYDIGKAALPADILLRQEALQSEDLETLKTHAMLGHEAVLRASEAFPPPADFLRCAREITLSHEERWDGSGYPKGLSGEEIPVAARLVAIADGYDRLIGCGAAHEEAMAQIAEGKGTRFDPDVAEAFAAISKDIASIATRFAAPRAAR
jgi:putative two-component system response regulator